MTPISHDHISLNALHTFMLVAHFNSFKQCAEFLHLSETAVSHRIRTLEQHLGFRLFIRQTRHISLSTQGKQLYDSIAMPMQQIHHALDSLRHQRERVSLSTTPEFASHWLIPHMNEFQLKHPSIDLHIHTSYQAVNLYHDGIDFAIRYGDGIYDGVDSTFLFQERFAPVASSQLAMASDCCEWTLVHLDWHNQGADVINWQTWGKYAGVTDTRWQDTLARGVHYSDGNQQILAVIAGVGVGLLGLGMIAAPLSSGLIRIASELVLMGKGYHLCHQNSQPLSPSMQAVKSWLVGVVQDGEI